MRLGIVVLTLAAIGSSAEADTPSGLAGPWRVAFNFGYPELIGFGFGRTLADDWRVSVDVGTIVFVSTLTVHGQRLLFRKGIFATTIGVQAAVLREHAIIGEYPQAETDYAAGARLGIELGRPRGIGFVIEGGADAHTNYVDGRYAASLAFRLTFSF